MRRQFEWKMVIELPTINAKRSSAFPSASEQVTLSQCSQDGTTEKAGTHIHGKWAKPPFEHSNTVASLSKQLSRSPVISCMPYPSRSSVALGPAFEVCLQNSRLANSDGPLSPCYATLCSCHALLAAAVSVGLCLSLVCWYVQSQE